MHFICLGILLLALKPMSLASFKNNARIPSNGSGIINPSTLPLRPRTLLVGLDDESEGYEGKNSHNLNQPVGTVNDDKDFISSSTEDLGELRIKTLDEFNNSNPLPYSPKTINGDKNPRYYEKNFMGKQDVKEAHLKSVISSRPFNEIDKHAKSDVVFMVTPCMLGVVSKSLFEKYPRIRKSDDFKNTFSPSVEPLLFVKAHSNTKLTYYTSFDRTFTDPMAIICVNKDKFSPLSELLTNFQENPNGKVVHFGRLLNPQQSDTSSNIPMIGRLHKGSQEEIMLVIFPKSKENIVIENRQKIKRIASKTLKDLYEFLVELFQQNRSSLDENVDFMVAEIGDTSKCINQEVQSKNRFPMSPCKINDTSSQHISSQSSPSKKEAVVRSTSSKDQIAGNRWKFDPNMVSANSFIFGDIISSTKIGEAYYDDNSNNLILWINPTIINICPFTNNQSYQQNPSTDNLQHDPLFKLNKLLEGSLQMKLQREGKLVVANVFAAIPNPIIAMDVLVIDLETFGFVPKYKFSPSPLENNINYHGNNSKERTEQEIFQLNLEKLKSIGSQFPVKQKTKIVIIPSSLKSHVEDDMQNVIEIASGPLENLYNYLVTLSGKNLPNQHPLLVVVEIMGPVGNNNVNNDSIDGLFVGSPLPNPIKPGQSSRITSERLDLENNSTVSNQGMCNNTSNPSLITLGNYQEDSRLSSRVQVEKPISYLDEQGISGLLSIPIFCRDFNPKTRLPYFKKVLSSRDFDTSISRGKEDDGKLAYSASSDLLMIYLKIPHYRPDDEVQIGQILRTLGYSISEECLLVQLGTSGQLEVLNGFDLALKQVTATIDVILIDSIALNIVPHKKITLQKDLDLSQNLRPMLIREINTLARTMTATSKFYLSGNGLKVAIVPNFLTEILRKNLKEVLRASSQSTTTLYYYLMSMLALVKGLENNHNFAIMVAEIQSFS